MVPSVLFVRFIITLKYNNHHLYVHCHSFCVHYNRFRCVFVLNVNTRTYLVQMYNFCLFYIIFIHLKGFLIPVCVCECVSVQRELYPFQVCFTNMHSCTFWTNPNGSISLIPTPRFSMCPPAVTDQLFPLWWPSYRSVRLHTSPQAHKQTHTHTNADALSPLVLMCHDCVA